MACTHNGVAPGDVNDTRACACPETTTPPTTVPPAHRTTEGRLEASDGFSGPAGSNVAGSVDRSDETVSNIGQPEHGEGSGLSGGGVLPPELHATIEASVASALAASFPPDPSFSPALSRLVSIAASMQKRHGNILLEAMAVGLEAGGNVTVLRTSPDCRIDVCPTARRVARTLGHDGCALIDLGYDGAPDEREDDGPRTVDVDAIVIDQRDGSALAIESKRGGKVGAPALRQLLESTTVVATLLRAHLKRHGQSVSHGDARVLIHHADRGLSVPDALTTTLDELDRRYGGHAGRTVAAATALHARLVREAMAEPLRLAVHETCGTGSLIENEKSASTADLGRPSAVIPATRAVAA